MEDPLAQVPIEYPTVKLAREVYEARFTVLSYTRLEEMEVESTRLSVDFVKALQGPKAMGTLARLAYACLGKMGTDDVWAPIQKDWQWIAAQVGFDRLSELRDAIVGCLGKAFREATAAAQAAAIEKLPATQQPN